MKIRTATHAPSPLRFLLLCGLLPALAVVCTYVLAGLFLRGDGLPLFGNAGQAYLDLLTKTHLPLSEAGFSSFSPQDSISLFFRSYRSPFTWLLLLSPDGLLPVALTLVAALRAAAAGITFGLLARQISPEAPLRICVATSLLYATGAFPTLFVTRPDFADAWILLPLLGVGVYRILGQRKPAALALTLGVLFLLCPQMALLSLPFLVIALLTLCFLRRPHDGVYMVLLFLIALLVGALTGMAALFYLWNTLRNWFSVSVSEQTAVLDILVKLFDGTYDGLNTQIRPYLAVGVLPLLTLPLFFAAKAIPLRVRIGVLPMLGLFAASLFFRVSDIFPYPQAAFFSLLLATITVYVLPRLTQDDQRMPVPALGFLLVLLIVLQKLPFETGAVGSSPVSDTATVWLTLFCAVALTGVLLGLCRTPEICRPQKGALAALLVAVIFAESILSSAGLVSAVKKDGGLPERSAYADSIDTTEKTVGFLAQDGSFYRVERLEGASSAASALLPELSGETTHADLLAACGLGYVRDGSFVYTPSFLGADTLFGLQYLILETPDEEEGEEAPLLPSAYTLVYEDEYYTVYENPYALPALTVLQQDIVSVESAQAPLILNAYYRALTGEDAYTPMSARVVGNYCQTPLEYEGHYLYRATSSTYQSVAAVRVEFVADAETEDYYLALSSAFPRNAVVFVDNIPVSEIFRNQPDPANTTALQTPVSDCVCLGSFRNGQRVRVDILFGNTSSDDMFYLNASEETLIFRQNSAVLAQAKESADRQVTSCTLTTGALDIRLTGLEQETALLLSLPYQAGYRIRANGVEITCSEAAGGLVALTVPAGTEQITVSLPGDLSGLWFSLSGLLFAAVLFFWERRLREDGKEHASVVEISLPGEGNNP